MMPRAAKKAAGNDRIQGPKRSRRHCESPRRARSTPVWHSIRTAVAATVVILIRVEMCGIKPSHTPGHAATIAALTAERQRASVFAASTSLGRTTTAVVATSGNATNIEHTILAARRWPSTKGATPARSIAPKRSLAIGAAVRSFANNTMTPKSATAAWKRGCWISHAESLVTRGGGIRPFSRVGESRCFHCKSRCSSYTASAATITATAYSLFLPAKSPSPAARTRSVSS
mmetsp:Transcript_9571/g.31733  ORF Transcript_9571/g.31733 Transcript_9571/m.31733 type:complete len:231 (-) Transcript_9571:321-1013(-)